MRLEKNNYADNLNKSNYELYLKLREESLSIGDEHSISSLPWGKLMYVGRYVDARHCVIEERKLKNWSPLNEIEIQYELENSLAEIYVTSYLPAHVDTLVRKYKQLVIIDDYGVEDKSRWLKELEYFTEQMHTLHNIGLFPGVKEIFADAIHAEVMIELEYLFDEELLGNDFIGSDPNAYEVWCADQLTKSGWLARLTKATGDQGIDIIAERGGRTIGIQCKLYSKPVGNKAVQEAFAGISFHGIQVGAVITNSTYTLSAKKLANSTGILLLHHSELIDFDLPVFID